jgi:hypothetical protein
MKTSRIVKKDFIIYAYMILYIEQQIINHPRTQQICDYFPKAQKIIISHYKNIFDRKFPNSIVGDPSTPLSLRSG